MIILAPLAVYYLALKSSKFTFSQHTFHIRGARSDHLYRLINDNGVRVHDPAHYSGEILVRGPSLMQEYISNAAATRETIDADGWLHTGDVATIINGKIYIVDRKKELIKVRGWQVAPAELEGVLLTHPCIADAAVIGVSHADAPTEIPRAYVVRKPDNAATALTEESVKGFLLAHLAKYKVGDCEVRFRDSIPKSMSGKILRKLLREGVERESKVEANPARSCDVEQEAVYVDEKTNLLSEAQGVVSEKDHETMHNARLSLVALFLLWLSWLWARCRRIVS